MINLSHMGLSSVTLDVLIAEVASANEGGDGLSSSNVIDDDGAGLSSITGLDLSHNQISDLDFLSHLPSLQTLILDHNQLRSHLRLPVLPSLTTFWANHNDVANLPIFVSTLSVAFPNLAYLSLMNNPCAPSYLNGGTVKAYRDYRQFVIGKLGMLLYLDDRPVTKLEKADATKVYGGLEL